jgi:DNA-binding transcriptional LysR family regulator
VDLRHLRYFLCVAEEMHFGRAAARLGISQPPLSQQIRALEDELGVRLFERTSRRVRLTRPGQLFLPEAQQTLAQAERAIQTAREAHRGEIGHLSLGYTTSGPFVPIVAGALYRFRKSYPRIELRLHELPNEEQIVRVENRRLDIGLLRKFSKPVLPAGIERRMLLEENMVLVVHQSHRLARRADDPAIADLRDEPLVFYAPSGAAGFHEHIFALCREEGFVPNIVQEASSLATLLGLVAAGFGATIVGQSLGRLHLDNLCYRRLATPVTSRVWLIHNQDLSPTAEAFRATLIAQDGQAAPLAVDA